MGCHTGESRRSVASRRRPCDHGRVAGDARDAARRGRWWPTVIAASVLFTACSSSDEAIGDDAASDVVGDLSADAAGDVDPADFVGLELTDRRPAILSELGAPDSFVITVDEVDGTVSRFESWSYFDARTQIDFVDGELLWDLETEPLPDGSWLPLGYSPMEFEMLASVDETLESLGDVELSEIDATDMEVDGAEVWAGEQLLLVFVDDQLVLVETFPLSTDEPEVVG